MNTSNLTRTAVGLCAFAAGVSVSFFTLPIWVATLQLATREGSRSDWLGFAGGLMGNALTGMIAALAILYGWRGIERQMRINLVSREEDRMERQLPGLEQAYALLQSCLTIPFPIDFGDALKVQGIDSSKEITAENLAREMPAADFDTRRSLATLMNNHLGLKKVTQNVKTVLVTRQEQIAKKETALSPDETADWQEFKDKQEFAIQKLEEACTRSSEAIVKETQDIDDRIQTMRNRIRSARQEIEQYFHPQH